MDLRIGGAAVLVAGIMAMGQARPPAASAGRRVSFLAGSTQKLEQLIGDVDKQTHAPTPSRTLQRYGVEGTDLGNSFEHAGRVYFLFGDTLGTLGRALDTIGVSDAHDAGPDVRLDFLTARPSDRGAGGRRGRGRGRAAGPAGEHAYLTIQPDGVRMGPFEVPVGGISLDGHMYVVVSTGHSDDRSSDRSILTKFGAPDTFQPLRTISQLPSGHFVKMSLRLQPAETEGLPAGGPFVLMFGTGRYRSSDAYLAITPAASFETGAGTRYFAGLEPSGAPRWSDREEESAPIMRNGTMGDVSVTWCRELRLWLMTYDSRPPAARGILFAYARAPWGPWSEPQIIFDGVRDHALGTFIHVPRSNPPDDLTGPVIGQGKSNPEGVHGGAYAPYVVERWTRLRDGRLDLHYVLSTWNPYVVVLMRSSFTVN